MDLFTNQLLLLQRRYMNENNRFKKWVFYYKLWGCCYSLICLREGFFDSVVFDRVNRVFRGWYSCLSVNDLIGASRFEMRLKNEFLLFENDINIIFNETDRVLAERFTFSDELGVDLMKPRGSFSVLKDGVDHVYLPSFAIAESSDNFLHDYKKTFPELLTDYSHLIERFDKFELDDRMRVRKKYDVFVKRRKEQIAAKRKAKEQKKKLKEEKREKKKLSSNEKKSYKLLIGKQAYESFKDGETNFSAIGRKLGVLDRNKLIRWAGWYAVSIDDVGFEGEVKSAIKKKR